MFSKNCVSWFEPKFRIRQMLESILRLVINGLKPLKQFDTSGLTLIINTNTVSKPLFR